MISAVNFKVGDRIICRHSTYSPNNGRTGIVRSVLYDPDGLILGVKFDDGGTTTLRSWKFDLIDDEQERRRQHALKYL